MNISRAVVMVVVPWLVTVYGISDGDVDGGSNGGGRW